MWNPICKGLRSEAGTGLKRFKRFNGAWRKWLKGAKWGDSMGAKARIHRANMGIMRRK